MKIEMIVFVICCSGLSALWCWWWFYHVTLPAAVNRAEMRGETRLRAAVRATARLIEGHDSLSIRAVCEGGPLDGVVFFPAIDADTTTWMDPRSGEPVATYAMAFRADSRGAWVFRHVAPTGKAAA